MVRVYLSLGSNLGDRKAHLERAVEQLRAEGIAACRSSSVFETEPVGYAAQPWFLNRVVEAETALTPEELLSACQRVEDSEGRVRTFRNAPRTLDLDILLHGATELETPDLVIPHPRMAERRFVLAPLAEIAPHLVHPRLRHTMLSLLEQCQDPSKVRLYPPEDCDQCKNT